MCGSAHDCGCMVDGSSAMAALLIISVVRSEKVIHECLNTCLSGTLVNGRCSVAVKDICQPTSHWCTMYNCVTHALTVSSAYLCTKLHYAV